MGRCVLCTFPNGMKASVTRKILASFVLATAVLAAAALLLDRGAMQFRQNRENIGRTREVTDELQDLLVTLQEAETGARGYILTGNSTDLASYDSAGGKYPVILSRLQSLTADNSKQTSNLAQLQAHVAKRLRLLKETVDIRQNLGMEAARRRVLTGAGRHEMAEIRRLIARMQSEENRVLEQSRLEYDASVQRINLMFACAIGTQFILLLLGLGIVLRYVNRQAASAREIESAHARLSATLATTGDGIYQLDEQGKLVYLNPAAEQLLGYKLEEIRGANMHDLIHSRTPEGERRPAEKCPLQAVLHNGKPHKSGEEWYQGKDGTFLTVECTSTPLTVDGRITGAVFSFHDITARRHREEALRSTTALRKAILDGAGLSIISTDAYGTITTFNTAAERMLQYQESEVIGKVTLAFIHDPEEIERRARQLTTEMGVTIVPGFDVFAAKTARTGIPYESEWTYIRKDESRFPVHLSVMALRDAEGNISGFLSIAEDITERKKAEAALRESESRLKEALERERDNARNDFLTRIPNRRAFYEIAATEAQRSRRYDRPLTLVYVDLDNFKAVNDSLGHEAGDELLVAVAATIQSAVRGSDTVARLGGDEFAVLLPETDQQSGEVVTRKLQHVLLSSMQEHNWPVTFSIGLISYRVPPESVSEMIRKADEAMYSVKLKGKNSVAAHAGR
jgi:diguanylate cyclase (GGDEF)-like protein/PAS domain S-box-containing protein